MEFYLRRPVYKAVQFDGTTESAEKIQDITRAYGYNIRKELLNGSGAILTVLIGTQNGDRNLEVRQDDYVVVAPDDGMSVVEWREFKRMYESASLDSRSRPSVACTMRIMNASHQT